MSELDSRKYMVYLYEFPNGKIYIGMTHLTIQKRRDNGYQHNTKLTEAIRNYGWANVTKTVLADGLTRQQAEEYEITFINRYKSALPEFGYNVSRGGRKTFEGLHHTKEHKEYMSKILTGRKFSEEHKDAIKKAHCNLRHPVFSIDLETGKATQYESLCDAAKAVGGYSTNISRAIEKENKMYKGFYWRKGVLNGETATVR